ncbi:hypothetical protein NECAME_09983 [Necator americanus]|uniref:Uncharacterized protein n=1 Tax=Necator americanus TaxID=51031 RepID=W2TD78_NECAM|nr:hypothetical protein NECAME_09983 [Necator americanus]ETN79146.1 hypothetical protein NECAME_09983 [Necator americanus]
MSSITKRTVTSAISAIYDPLGWQIPLLHKIKIFLQDLWKDQYDWDVRLPDTKVEEWKWNGITAQINWFEKDLPRFLQEKKGEVILVTFAVASTNTMAACTYLHSNTSAQLLMAKSKLPSLQCHYVRDRNLCQYCLMDCDPNRRCRCQDKPCWYCSVVRRTILDFLIPMEGGHHRAFCNIPNSKEKIAARIDELEREIEEARQRQHQ